MINALTVWMLLAAGGAAEPPRVVVARDDVRITESCVIEVPPGVVISDSNGDGVIHIEADGVTVRFAEGSVLRGSGIDAAPNTYRGVGITIRGHKGARIEEARISGFKIGLLARGADGLAVVGGFFDDNYRQRLRSTPLAEDGADWLFPHENDRREWVTQHGAAVCIERSEGVEVSKVKVRRGQNGLILDRVNGAKVFDNDMSFLSGWGLAMWRSSRNTISRNALDFCVRGHSEGVYNRGQDSAGILCFEQCNENLFVENSVTHGGDGFFGFAGKEALGEKPAPAGGIDYADAGCNRNIFARNDLSYAAAHGLELTFSEENIIWDNRFAENAICGIWGGYSSGSWIVGNVFERNGGMAYGLERGGINMEHASRNVILSNRFENNRCGVHLWWDDDAALLRLPGVKAGYRGVSENIIGDNRFVMDADNPWTKGRMVGTQLRDAGKGNVRDNFYAGNIAVVAAEGASEIDVPPDARPTLCTLPDFEPPKFEVLGDSRPVGVRRALRGRDQIIMGEWGPWDHESPMLRSAGESAEGRVFELFGVRDANVMCQGAETDTQPPLDPSNPASPWRITVRPRDGDDVAAFRLSVETIAGAWKASATGVMTRAVWRAKFFEWKKDVDPRERLEDWRLLADAASAVELGSLRLPFGHGGPRACAMAIADEQRSRLPEPGDHFGMIATTRLRLPAGDWRVRVLSDDGIRVTADGAAVVENWTWHGPTTNEGVLRVDRERVVEFGVEYFEIDGYAVLELTLERVGD
ncbi:MAG: NosD domain-containing protein [Phycisphaerales bacterium]